MIKKTEKSGETVPLNWALHHLDALDCVWQGEAAPPPTPLKQQGAALRSMFWARILKHLLEVEKSTFQEELSSKVREYNRAQVDLIFLLVYFNNYFVWKDNNF